MKSTAVVGLATLFSRILGLIRDVAMAAIFGASMVLDAFVLAFTLPNLFRQFFGEGVLSSSFIPVFTEKLEKEGRSFAFTLANRVVTLLIAVLAAIVVVGLPLCVWLSTIPSLGEKNSLALSLTAVMLPYLLLICVTAMLGGTLNALRHFFIPALSPAVLNIVWLVGIFLTVSYLEPDPQKWVYGMAIAILIGGMLQLLLQIPPLRRLQLDLRPDWNTRDPAVRKVLWNIVPVLMGTAALQINVLVNRLIAWWMIPYDGALTVLYMGNRLVQFPLAFIGISLATVVFPMFSRHVARGEVEKLASEVPQALRIALFLSLPASVGLMLLAGPIIFLIYQHNQFGTEAASRTTAVLIAYGAGLWVYTLLQIVAKVFYSLGDMRTPMRIASWCVLSNLLMNLILVSFWQETGLALATTLNALLNYIVLFYLLQKKIALHWDGIGAFTLHTLICVAVMGGCVFFVSSCFGAPTNFTLRLLNVIVPVIAGCGVYFACAALLRIPELGKIIRP